MFSYDISQEELTEDNEANQGATKDKQQPSMRKVKVFEM